LRKTCGLFLLPIQVGKKHQWKSRRKNKTCGFFFLNPDPAPDQFKAGQDQVRPRQRREDKMLKILERCLKADRDLCERHKLDQIVKSIPLPDPRTIGGKPLMN
jgi:hypothetical protein